MSNSTSFFSDSTIQTYPKDERFSRKVKWAQYRSDAIDQNCKIILQFFGTNENQRVIHLKPRDHNPVGPPKSDSRAQQHFNFCQFIWALTSWLSHNKNNRATLTFIPQLYYWLTSFILVDRFPQFLVYCQSIFFALFKGFWFIYLFFDTKFRCTDRTT